jgi:hypothetical protein
MEIIFTIIIGILASVILGAVSRPATKVASIYSKEENELNEILLQKAEDRRVEAEINRIAWEQYWNWIESGRGKFSIVQLEYCQVYRIIHPATAKYKSGNINKEIQELYNKLCADKNLNIKTQPTWQK